jgi:ribosome modulation factor
MLMMAIGIEKAVEHGYRVGYEDGITGQSCSITARDEASLVLH